MRYSSTTLGRVAAAGAAALCLALTACDLGPGAAAPGTAPGTAPTSAPVATTTPSAPAVDPSTPSTTPPPSTTSPPSSSTSVPSSEPTTTSSPAPPGALSPEAADLLAFVQGVSGERILTGQHNYTIPSAPFSARAEQLGGAHPALWGGDFGWSGDDVPSRAGMVDEAIRQHEAGSVVTLMWHMCPPTTAEPCQWTDVQSDVSDAQWQELLTPGTALHEVWLQRVDEVAGHLRRLQEAGVPVLWRPYHEMNGGWFWWGQRPGAAGYLALWEALRERLVGHHGLDNLVWVWNANAPNAYADPYAAYEPGPASADVLAADVYNADFRQSHHDDLLALAAGRPIALGEVGALPDPGVLDAQPGWAWFMVWPDSLEGANSPEQVRAAYDHPRAVTRDELPALGWPAGS